MPWSWGIYAALGIVTLFILLELVQRRRELGCETVLAKEPRPLKPRTPEDCPICQHPHLKSLWGHARISGVEPRPMRKSPRGKHKQICTARHACPNPECDYWGNTDPTFHALVGNGVRHGIQQLKCQACQKQFSSRWGTTLYRLRASAWDVSRVLFAVNVGLSMTDIQWLFGHLDTTLRIWLTRAGNHAEKVHAHFFRNLQISHLQFDELYTTLRDKAHELWVWVAFDLQTKLIPALCLGPRTQDLAHALVHAVKRILAPGCVPACSMMASICTFMP
jgi:transposase-like protein